jgi:putative endopeptidase
MVKQAEQFQVFGVNLKGKLTCGENIADLGGLKLSLRALQASLVAAGTTEERINGFTPLQRFFLAWSQCWRENSKKERALQLVTLDPHGPNELRCNGPLSNMTEFHDAFGIKSGDLMYKEPTDRVDIW